MTRFQLTISTTVELDVPDDTLGHIDDIDAHLTHLVALGHGTEIRSGKAVSAHVPYYDTENPRWTQISVDAGTGVLWEDVRDALWPAEHAGGAAA